MIIHATVVRACLEAASSHAETGAVRRRLPERALHERRQVHGRRQLQPDGAPPPRHRRRFGRDRTVDGGPREPRDRSPRAQVHGHHAPTSTASTAPACSTPSATSPPTPTAAGGGDQHPGRRRPVRPAHRDPSSTTTSTAPRSGRCRWPAWPERRPGSGRTGPRASPDRRLTGPHCNPTAGMPEYMGCNRRTHHRVPGRRPSRAARRCRPLRRPVSRRRPPPVSRLRWPPVSRLRPPPIPRLRPRSRPLRPRPPVSRPLRRPPLRHPRLRRTGDWCS